MVNFVAPRSLAISAADLVVAPPVADKDQRHQADPQGKCDNDAQSHSEPAGGADLGIADAGPQDRNQSADDDDDDARDCRRYPIERRFHCRSAATCLRSLIKRSISRRRVSSSGARSRADGCTVASAHGASAKGTSRPRSRFTRKCFPNKACAAVAPSATTIRGLTTLISASSHGKQASISTAPGLLWMRRGPRGTHLKCLTTLVT